MAENCKFCQIAAHNLMSFIVYEENELLVFLDNRPLFAGHCLLIPKTHFQTLYDIPDVKLSALFITAKTIGKAIEKAMNAEGSFVAANNIVSQSVPHFHLHIVPRTKGDGLKGFFWPRTSYRDETEIQTIQARIKECVREIQGSK